MRKKIYDPAKRKPRSANWTEEGKVEAIKLLQKNNYQVTRTAKDLSISPFTLRKWMKQFEVTPPPKKRSDEIKGEIKLIFNDLDHEGVKVNCFKLKELALKKLETLIRNSTNIRVLNETIKLLHEIAPPPEGIEGGQDDKGNILDILYTMNKEAQA